jgi:hypothetical protein
MHHEHSAHCGYLPEEYHQHEHHAHATLALGKACCAGACRHPEHHFQLAQQQLLAQDTEEVVSKKKKKKYQLGALSLESLGLTNEKGAIAI